MLGLGRTLAIEGGRKNILSNIIAPIAGSRLTESIWNDDIIKATSPDYVAPLVIKLCDEASKENGSLFEVGASWFAKVRQERSQGVAFGLETNISAEQVAERWDEICDFTDSESVESVLATFNAVTDKVGIDLLAPKK
ncbi:MAG: Putative short-chain type dehydrogenase/reductase [SAR92 bacterium MED-G29]|nr:MAG: Putative short-chain type dehydrogenase/reductase [SAR92 bacterium MED-G29]